MPLQGKARRQSCPPPVTAPQWSAGVGSRKGKARSSGFPNPSSLTLVPRRQKPDRCPFLPRKQVLLEDSDLDEKMAWLLGQQLSVVEVHSPWREGPLRDARCAGVLNNRLQHPAQVDSDERSSPPQPPGAHPWWGRCARLSPPPAACPAPRPAPAPWRCRATRSPCTSPCAPLPRPAGGCVHVSRAAAAPQGRAPYAAPLVASLRASRHVRGEAARTCKNFPKRVLINYTPSQAKGSSPR